MENCSRSGEKPPLKNLYELTRDHITHEDDLVNSRLTWFLVVQSLLFAAYGVTLEAPQVGQSTPLQIQLLETVIPWIGIAASILVFSSILGARLTILHMQKFWFDQDTNEISHFPPIVCKACAKWLGDAEAYVLPFVFGITWVCISSS